MFGGVELFFNLAAIFHDEIASELGEFVRKTISLVDALEFYRVGRVVLSEVIGIFNTGAGEAIDRLSIVADSHEVGAAAVLESFKN